jgi:hypothetical protein
MSVFKFDDWVAATFFFFFRFCSMQGVLFSLERELLLMVSVVLKSASSCKETLHHIVLECDGYEDKDLFNFICKCTTGSYKISMKLSDEKNKANWLIRSQFDFTLAYNDPTDREREECI